MAKLRVTWRKNVRLSVESCEGHKVTMTVLHLTFDEEITNYVNE